MRERQTLQHTARDQRVAARAARWAAGTGLLSLAMGLFVLFGWIVGSRPITAILPHMATMKPPTAIGFVLVGLALWLRSSSLTRGRPGMRIAASVCAAVTIVLMALILVQFIAGRDWGLSLAIARIFTDDAHMDPVQAAAAWSPVMTPAPATAVGFICLSLALLCLDAQRHARIRPPELLAAGGLVIGLTALLIFIFDIEELYRFQPYTSLALHTALGFIVLAAGVFLARTGGGVAALLVAGNAGGTMSRRLIPATLLGPIVLAGLGLAGERAGWYGANVRSVLLAISNAAFLSGAVLAAAWALSRTDEARRRGEARQALMMAELDHRVKNTLAAILSLTELTIVSADSLPKFGETFRGRLRAMARTHEALAASKWEGVRLQEVVRLTVSPMAGTRLSFDGPDVLLPARASSSICMALHELATNAAKYGGFRNVGGKVELSWSVDGANVLSIVWSEAGSPTLTRPTRIGFGTELIQGAIGHELGGEVNMTYDPPGLGCRMRIPLEPLRNEALEHSMSS